jgi:predicted MFS family arabinose efflux permease
MTVSSIKQQAVVEDRASRHRELTALITAAIVFVLYVWDRVAVPIFLVEIRAAYDLSLAAAGLLASIFTFGLALTAVIAGFLVAKYGMRVSLIVSTLLFSASTGYIATGFHFADLAVARVLGGIGEGIYIVALLSYLSTLSERYRAAAMGLPGTLFGVGIFAAPIVLNTIAAYAGWRGTFLVLMAAGAGGAMVLAIITNKIENFTSQKSGDPITWLRIRKVLTPYVLALVVIMAINGIGIYGMISVLVAYLRISHHLDTSTAGYIYGLFGVGAIIGGTPLGLMADRFGRNIAMPILAVIAAISGAAVFAAPSSPIILGILTLLFGTSANALYVICLALVRDRSGQTDGPLSIGLVATAYYLFGAVSGWILGVATETFGFMGSGLAVYLIPYLLALLIFWIVASRESSIPA